MSLHSSNRCCQIDVRVNGGVEQTSEEHWRYGRHLEAELGRTQTSRLGPMPEFPPRISWVTGSVPPGGIFFSSVLTSGYGEFDGLPPSQQTIACLERLHTLFKFFDCLIFEA